MTEPVKRPMPGIATRFQKGRSGNPKGRPRQALKAEPSIFEILSDRTVKLDLDGQKIEAGLEQALLFKTYQDAMQGKPKAQQEVLAMIREREEARAAKNKKPFKAGIRFDQSDDAAAHEAMALLGISTPGDENDSGDLKLEAWAVKLALKRSSLPLINAESRNLIMNSTKRDPSLVWPWESRDA